MAKLSDHPLIQRLLKGIYHNRPPKPRYAFIWDSDKVINYLATLNIDDLDFKMLSYKCVTLLPLLSGQRVRTLHKFKCSSLQLTDCLAQFQVVDLLKHSTPHHKQQPVLFSSYPYNLNLCPVKLSPNTLLFEENCRLLLLIMFSVVIAKHMDLHPETHYLAGSKIPSNLLESTLGRLKHTVVELLLPPKLTANGFR